MLSLINCVFRLILPPPRLLSVSNHSFTPPVYLAPWDNLAALGTTGSEADCPFPLEDIPGFAGQAVQRSLAQSLQEEQTLVMSRERESPFHSPLRTCLHYPGSMKGTISPHPGLCDLFSRRRCS